MQKLFTKILVPVDFNRNTRWSVEKAIHLANKFNCDILLLHVQAPPSTIPFLYNTFFSGSFSKSPEKDLKKKMKDLEQLYRPKLKDGILMTSVIQVGFWQSILKDVIIAEHIDLFLIPRNRRRLNEALIKKININKLSQQTNCSIMTVTRSFNANHLQKIVVPVNDLLPIKKLTIATYLSLESSGCIHLMGESNHSISTIKGGYLIRAYQLLNDFGNLNIQCALQDNDNTATGTLAYAQNVNADLIVVNPGRESRLRGWWNKLSGKYLSRESDIPVLTVAV